MNEAWLVRNFSFLIPNSSYLSYYLCLKKSMEIIVDGIEDLGKTAETLVHYAGTRKKWLFKGEIGAGKTTFIQSICTLLGVQGKTNSPTFSLINEYAYLSSEGVDKWIHHIDLYRLNSLEEAIDIGIEDYLYDENYCFIEWPQLIAPILPPEVVQINLEIIEDSKRKILFL